MSESLIIKDGLGSVKTLQVDSGSNGYIPIHSIISTTTGAFVATFYPDNNDGGWDWNSELSGTSNLASFNKDRKYSL